MNERMHKILNNSFGRSFAMGLTFSLIIEADDDAIFGKTRVVTSMRNISFAPAPSAATISGTQFPVFLFAAKKRSPFG